MSHSFWSPSKSHMWMNCHGAMAQPENQVPGKSSEAADSGTATHELSAWALENNKDATDFPELTIQVGGTEYDVDSERCDFAQTYIDEVRRRAMGGIMLIEHRVDLGEYLGVGPCWKCDAKGDASCDVCQGTHEAPQGGTSDAVIVLPKEETLISMDLKYGVGEKVWAAFWPDPKAKKRKINTQCGNYLLGAWKQAKEMGYKITKFIAIIDQPRLNHRDEFEITVEELETFADEVRLAIERGSEAMTLGVEDPKLDEYLSPGEKTCRWCNAVVRCKARARHVNSIVRLEFDDESHPNGTQVPQTLEHLSAAYEALPLIRQWVREVDKALWEQVPKGTVIGPDGQPLKLVTGKLGNRMWDPTQGDEIEGLVVGAVGPAAYTPPPPPKLLSAPQFETALKKKLRLKGKKFTAHWDLHWKKYIINAKGALQIALGSDTRPAAGKADASEFNDEISAEGNDQ